MSDDLVKIAVRIRPLIQSEVDKGCQTCLNVIPGEQQIQIQPTEKSFTFNHVFASEISQEEFYNTAIKNMVSNIFEGYNVTILAYGQTGSGKTFSMGTNYNENDANCGVIPRAINDIFEHISAKEEFEFKVTVAFMELYNEQLFDLLSKKPRNQCVVDIREDVKGIKIFGLSEVTVKNTQETLKCLMEGSSCRAISSTSDLMSNSIEENGLHNETYDLDEKHEEHTMQQAVRVDEVQYINRQLAIKEELVTNLLKNSSQIAEYQKELEEMESEIKNLQTEREELMQALRNAQTSNASAKLAGTRRKKVQELEKKIAELSRKCLEQNKVIKNKKKSDLQIKNLSNEIANLKQTRVKLIKNMRTETDKFNKWKRSREQELYKLKDQDRKRLNQITKLQAEHNRQKNVFKRKMEEAQAIQKRLKDALDLQKKAAQRREQAANAKESVHTWVTQELEVLLSTVDAECIHSKNLSRIKLT